MLAFIFHIIFNTFQEHNIWTHGAFNSSCYLHRQNIPRTYFLDESGFSENVFKARNEKLLYLLVIRSTFHLCKYRPRRTLLSTFPSKLAYLISHRSFEPTFVVRAVLRGQYVDFTGGGDYRGSSSYQHCFRKSKGADCRFINDFRQATM